MGRYASVCVVFGIDYGNEPISDEAREVADKASTVEFTTAEGEESRHHVLFASKSHRPLLQDHGAKVPVLDVASLAAVRTNRWRDALLMFCQTHGVAWQEPRWLIVSDVS